MTRQLNDVWSRGSPHRQGEVLHRYVLGVYDLMDHLTRAFSNVLLENCSGGSGRFDAGMLYHSPQIWTVVSKNRKKAIVSYVLKMVTANTPLCYLRLRGLEADRIYRVYPLNLTLSGVALMHGGLPNPELYGDHPAMEFEITAVEI